MFSYIHAVSKENIELSYKDKNIRLLKSTEIKISPTFFKTIVCGGCGMCCGVGFYIILTESDFTNINNDSFHLDKIVVNGNDIDISTLSYEKNHFCPFLDTGKKYGCLIHGHHQITCHAPFRIPLFVKNKVYWTKKMYGRNWAWKDKSMMCKAQVQRKVYTQDEKTRDISFFEHLERVCEDISIENTCPEIIDTIKIRETVGEKISIIQWFKNDVNSS